MNQYDQDLLSSMKREAARRDVEWEKTMRELDRGVRLSWLMLLVGIALLVFVQPWQKTATELAVGTTVFFGVPWMVRRAGRTRRGASDEAR